MAELPFTITVDDDGSVVIKRFGQGIVRTASLTRKAARRMNESFKRVRASVNRLPGLIFNVKNALIGLGAAVVLRSIVSAGDVVERARARLVGLRGSIEGANEAFAFFQKVAGGVAFSLEEVITAGVSVEAFGAKSEDVLEVVTDLAGFMGTSLPEAASAFGRAFAGGAGAADILRERGVLTLVSLRTGIKDLTKLTLPEFREALLSAMRDPVGPIAGAAERLAKTWQGVVSFLGDSFFRLRQTLFESGVGDLLKSIVRTMTDLLNTLVIIVKNNASAIKSFFDELRSRLPTAQEILTGLETIALFFTVELPAALFRGKIAFFEVLIDIAEFVRPVVNAIVRLFLEGFATILSVAVKSLVLIIETLENANRILLKILGLTAQEARQLGADIFFTAGRLQQFEQSIRDSIEAPTLFDRAIVSLNESLRFNKRALELGGSVARKVSGFFQGLRDILNGVKGNAEESTVAVLSLAPALRLLQDQFTVVAAFQPFADLTPESIDQINALLDSVSLRQRERILQDLLFAELAKEQRVAFVEDEVSRILAIREVLRSGSVQLLGAIASFAQSSGEKAFKIAQAFNIAEAITSGILAVQRALASPPGPPFTIPLAAAIAIQTAANVQQIRSTKPGGGGGINAPTGGGGGVAAAGAPTAEAVPTEAGGRVISINVSGFIGDEATLASELSRVLRDADEDEVRTTVSRI